MKRYEYVFAGGGLAGLSLATRLAESPLGDRPILVLDRDSKERNDRTWCFWSSQPTPLDRLARHAWHKILFVGDGVQSEIDLGQYRYQMIRGIDFYRSARQDLARYPNVEFRRARVETIEDDGEAVRVGVDGETVEGRWVFDSRFDLNAFHPDPARTHSLRQFFTGWEIEAPPGTFDPAIATLLDFRAEQKNAMRFYYVLPFSDSSALVEYVSLAQDHADQALQAYVQGVQGIQDYRILSAEGGVNPLTDYVFPRRAGRRILNLGIRGGRIKPSTGYAFRRIQSDSAAIVESLIRRGDPFDLPAESRRHRLLDSLMLDVMERHGEQVERVYSALFKHNPISRILRLLDDQSSLADNAALMASMPPQLFLPALGRLIGREWRASLSPAPRMNP